MSDRQLIKDALAYRSGENSCNSVYMGSMATASVYRCFGLQYGKGGLLSAIDNGTKKQITNAKRVCQNMINYMKKNPRTRCHCCGQIIPLTQRIEHERP